SAMKDIVTNLIEEKKISFLREGTFNEKLFGYVIYIHHIDKKEEILNDIVIFNKDEKQSDYLILAKRGSMQRDPQLNVSYMHLEDGSYTSLQDSFQHIEFKKAQVKVEHEEILTLGSHEKKLNLLELWQKRNDISEALYWFYNKLFMALAPLIFGLFIFGLVFIQARFNKTWSFAAILGGLLIYYGAMMNLRYKAGVLQGWMILLMLGLHLIVFSISAGLIYRSRNR
ncbi:MAG: LptF/LptG family permease, partial [Deltaproteobacteria bacterium]|nr:LptF/LptG family permease [Deltaproteobacteria bacterium]